MKHKFNRKLSFSSLVAIAFALIFTNCERDITDEAIVATYPTTADVYTDNPVGLTDEFFISFDPAGGANTEGFGTDNNEAYEGTSSIRIDVPAPNDPNGGFIGGIFKDRGNGRNLTGYNALTFWAKGSATGKIGTVGFGTDFEDGQYPVSRNNIQLTTDWKKYIIPIPDPSKLTQEKGLFLFSAGGLDIIDDIPNGNEIGWTFWIDEIRFEKLGTIAQVQAQILNGQDLVEQTYTNSVIPITGFRQVVNTGSGENISTNVSSAYFTFVSSDESVATVDESGNVTIVGTSGSATITAILGNSQAVGSLTVVSNGIFPQSPPPTHPAANVLSIFSDAYTDVVSPNFTPGFGGSTTVTSIQSIGGQEIANYSNNNFTGIMFDDNPIDGSSMTFMHVDVFVQDPAASIEFQIRDIGANQMIETNVFNGQPSGDDKDYRFTATGMTANAWNSFEIPLGGNLATQKNNLGAIILVGGPNFILDNIYFHN